MTVALEFPNIGHLESLEPQMETPAHSEQLEFLLAILRRLWRGRTDIYLRANATIYFNKEQLKNRDFRGPDLFVVKNPKQRKEGERNSWVVWEEDGRYPDLIIELLSESTAKNDRTEKKKIYQDIFRMPEYFYFAPAKTKTTEQNEFAGFRLVSGQYQPIQPNANGWLWSEVLGLYLGVRKGDFLGEYRELLRFYFPDGTLVPYPVEAEEQAEERLAREQEKRDRAEVKLARSEADMQALLEKLKAAGIDPEAL